MDIDGIITGIGIGLFLAYFVFPKFLIPYLKKRWTEPKRNPGRPVGWRKDKPKPKEEDEE